LDDGVADLRTGALGIAADGADEANEMIE